MENQRIEKKKSKAQWIRNSKDQIEGTKGKGDQRITNEITKDQKDQKRIKRSETLEDNIRR